MLTHLKSAEAWLKTAGKLPVQLKFLIEGEEEVGSESSETFIRGNAERLACQAIVISDGAQFAPGWPAINYGLRGIAYYELRLTGPARDLHSGTFGGSVANPANALAKILAQLIDDRGRVQIPGFYDDVVEVSDRERRQFARSSLRRGPLQGSRSASTPSPARRVTRPSSAAGSALRSTSTACGAAIRAKGARPCCRPRRGLSSASAWCPTRTPAKIARGLRACSNASARRGSLQLLDLHGGRAIMIPLDSPYMEAAARAIEYAFGRKPVYTREGGSIPIVSTFHETLHADTLLLGWGQDDDNTHSPERKVLAGRFPPRHPRQWRLWEELAAVKDGWRRDAGRFFSTCRASPAAD